MAAKLRAYVPPSKNKQTNKQTDKLTNMRLIVDLGASREIDFRELVRKTKQVGASVSVDYNLYDC